MVSTLAPFMALPSCRLAVVMRRVALYCPASKGAGQGDLLDHLSRRYLLAGVQHLVRVGQDQLKREVAGVALWVQQRHLYGLLVGRQADRRIAGNLDADCLAAVGGFVRQLIARPCAGALLQIRGEGVLLLAAGKFHARQYRYPNDHHRRDNDDYNVFFLQHDAALFLFAHGVSLSLLYRKLLWYSPIFVILALFAETHNTSGTNRHCEIVLTGSKAKKCPHSAFLCCAGCAIF